MDKTLEDHVTDMMGSASALGVVSRVLKNDAMYGEAHIIDSVCRDISEAAQAFEESEIDKSTPLEKLRTA